MVSVRSTKKYVRSLSKKNLVKPCLDSKKWHLKVQGQLISGAILVESIPTALLEYENYPIRRFFF